MYLHDLVKSGPQPQKETAPKIKQIEILEQLNCENIVENYTSDIMLGNQSFIDLAFITRLQKELTEYWINEPNEIASDLNFGTKIENGWEIIFSGKTISSRRIVYEERT